MNDVLGNELKKGDRIALVSTWYNDMFKEIETGTIIRFTDFYVWIKLDKPCYRWVGSKLPEDVTYRKPNRVIKI